MLLGESIANVVQKYLVVELKFLGAVPFDEKVHWSLKSFTPYLKKYPDTDTGEAVKSIAEKLVGIRETKRFSLEA